MSATTGPRHITNPFATRHTRPGVLWPLTSSAERRDVPALIAAVDKAGGSAGIEGPHGTGKSTLLVTIAAELAAVDRLAAIIQVRSRRDGLSAVRAVLRAAAGTTVCIDGWEQLGRVVGSATRFLARLRGCQLVVTSHRSVGLPLTVKTTSSLPLFTAIVAALPHHGGLIHPADLAEAFTRHGGNLRESLCDLYDRFEQRARQPFRF